jgi:hypothetical protein
MKITLHGLIQIVEAGPVSNVHLYTSQQRNTHQNKVCNNYKFIYYIAIFGEICFTVYLIPCLINHTDGPVLKCRVAHFHYRVVDYSQKIVVSEGMCVYRVFANRSSSINCIYLLKYMANSIVFGVTEDSSLGKVKAK